MTLKTCKDQLAIAEKLGNEELIKFWKERIAMKYPSEKVETVSNSKKK